MFRHSLRYRQNEKKAYTLALTHTRSSSPSSFSSQRRIDQEQNRTDRQTLSREGEKDEEREARRKRAKERECRANERRKKTERDECRMKQQKTWYTGQLSFSEKELRRLTFLLLHHSSNGADERRVGERQETNENEKERETIVEAMPLPPEKKMMNCQSSPLS